MAENNNENTGAGQQAQPTELELLQAKLAALEQERDAALAVNDDLQKKLEESEKTVDQIMIVVTHKKQKYQVLAKTFQHKGEYYKAEDLKKNAEIVEYLVSKGSGILKAL